MIFTVILPVLSISGLLTTSGSALASLPVPVAGPEQERADQTYVAVRQPDTFSLKMIGQVGGPTSAVAVRADPSSGSGQVYATVGVGLRLVVLDVTEPMTPTEVGATLPFPHFVEGIALGEDPSTGSGQAPSASSGEARAYVAAGGAGLRVVDISDPANPAGIGAWDSPDDAEGLALGGAAASTAGGLAGVHGRAPVDGPYFYVADGPYGLRVVDVSDPQNPRPVG